MQSVASEKVVGTDGTLILTWCRHALNGAFTGQFGMAFKAMLLPDAIPTIFPLSKKAGKAPTKKRGVFLKCKTVSG